MTEDIRPPKGLPLGAMIWFCVAASLFGLLLAATSYSLKARDQGYAAGYDVGVAHGRRVQLEHESRIMQSIGLCGYAKLVCTEPKEKSNGRKR